MRSLLKLKHISCKSGERFQCSKNLLFIKKDGPKYICTKSRVENEVGNEIGYKTINKSGGYVGYRVISNDEYCLTRHRRHINTTQKKSIFTDSRIKASTNEDNEGNANLNNSSNEHINNGVPFDNSNWNNGSSIQNNDDSANLINDGGENYFMNDNSVNKINDDNRKDTTIYQKDMHNNNDINSNHDESFLFDRDVRRKDDMGGENGFINYKSKRYNNSERSKHRLNSSIQQCDDDTNEDQYNSDQYSNDQYSNDQYSNDQYSNDRYSNDRYSNDRYSNDRYSNDRYSNDRYSNDRYFNKDEQVPKYSRSLRTSDRYSNLGDNLKEIEWSKVKVKIERQNLFMNNENNKQKNLTTEEYQNELRKYNIYVSKDFKLNNFITTFSDLNFHPSILNHLNSKYKEPTAIQKITWPIALSGKDLIGVAETGSGKTLAFVLPCLMHILKQKHKQKEKQIEVNEKGAEIEGQENGQVAQLNMNNSTEEDYQNDSNEEQYEQRNIYGLILLPTRELCMQVLEEIKVFEKSLNIKSTAVYGGVPKYFQINNIKKGVDIMVATPGRLLDYLENGIVNLLSCIYVVIDEADRLLDMGFEKQLRKIMTQINKNKQLLFLTATWPEQVRKLAYDFCSSDPVKIQIGKSELTANKNIEQNVIISSSIDLKKKLLDWLKENYENHKILIFCDTKRNCDNLCKELRYHQYNALAIHGDKQQRERDRILNNYKSDRCNILVATDVASRGLDIKNISVVINYDIPNTIEDYIHRIGRTGRAGNKGKSILFFPHDYYIPQKQRFAKELIKLFNKTNQMVPTELREIAGY
ncbi:DNA helicase 60 [Plasmodium brasilianum]|uniref:DNA helicase 60 n=1 Tax=Plasmodium brasilianum TaxID=5824 RepID=A0ACB9Y454_PLABR|nr:DNA helicase 60 [Plasmodium brasilianum]